jgi:glycerol-3-phosphate acyltransferase PlsX
MPTVRGRFLLLDAGANVDCTPENLEQFALVGSIYAEKVTAIASPRVGLLNIGGEPGKGNELVKEAYARLASSSLNFVGNIEGKDAFEGAADVVVCDGFAGNVLLKTGEGVAEMIISLLQAELDKEPQVREAFMPVFGRLAQRIDYAETGGAPLLGVNGVSVIGHGRSRAKAVANGIRVAVRAAESNFVGAIRDSLARLREGAP